jgi:predicted permease
VALVLLTGAGLLIHSFTNAIGVSPGFDPQGLITSRVALPAAYRVAARSVTFQRELLQALKDIPGVSDAALATGIPFEGGLPLMALSLKETTLPPGAPQPGAYQVGASIGYFEALHIQLIAGRFFSQADATANQQPYVVDEHFAKRYFPGRSAVGAHFTFGAPPAKDSDWPVIVGVVRYVPHYGVEDKSNIPFVYYPLLSAQPVNLSLFARSARPSGDLAALLHAKMRSIDPAIALFETRTVQSVIDESFDHRRAIMLLLSGFAGLALFLAALGIYGVLAYDVSQRTREIGIRGALGATRSQIIGLIMQQGGWKIGLGLGVGLPSALLLSRLMESQLFDLNATDPWAYVFVSLLLVAVAALASYLPARHAARIDPIEALRVD